jgi:pimeloyl-ACP methyl ester carboxylesterase
VWLATGRFCSRDRRIDYAARLPALVVPLLVVGGGRDGICPAQVAAEAYAKAGSADKELFIEPSATHGGLAFSEPALATILPRIEAWLDARLPSGAVPQAASD